MKLFDKKLKRKPRMKLYFNIARCVRRNADEGGSWYSYSSL